ncbi:response regulator [Bacillus mangrovi]|uniref:Response regulator n=1 Tax=Metabacillus mangrovi TaxID=1491830 RepID=A0A7X2S6K6_9BACI|nr:response regulator [Metabacillus mangrovi]MTH54587.1 response regulator [Metabacillus mangrovi]
MRLVIVDDEMIERKAMRKFVEESMTGFEVAGEAANGRLAVEMAAELKPDLMLMDIKMPGMNGLEAIRKIREIQPDIRFIMVSAYDSFDYAKEAMKEGVKEYILKPGKKEETIEALYRLKKEIEGERSAAAGKEEAANLMKQHLAEKSAQNQLSQQELEHFQQLFPNAKGGFFLVLSGCTAAELQPLLERHASMPYVFYPKSENRFAVLLLSENQEESAVRTEALRLARTITLAVKESRAGVGYPAGTLAKLGKSYQEAYRAWESITPGAAAYRFFRESAVPPAGEDQEKLRLSILNGNTEEALLLYSRLSEDPLLIKEWLSAAKYDLEKRGIDVQHISVLNADDLKETIRMLCEKVQWTQSEQEVAARAIQYMKARFTEPITLEETAEQTKLSPTYFTKVFKEQTGQTFIDYLTSLRMERAKELLANQDLSLKQIAYAAGYRDPNYFSRVFRKVTGQSPKQYRKKGAG